MENFLPLLNMTDVEMRSTKFRKQYDQSCFESFRDVVRVVVTYGRKEEIRERDILEMPRTTCSCMLRVVDLLAWLKNPVTLK